MFFPQSIHKDDRPAIVEWMLTRPEHPDDFAVNRVARWEYRLRDHGIFTQVIVFDHGHPDEFVVPLPPVETW